MILVLCILGALALAVIVATPKVETPLLLQTGMAVIALTIVVLGDTGDIPPAGGVALIVGFLLMAASSYRQKRKRKKELATGEPKVIDGRQMKRIHGGKHESR